MTIVGLELTFLVNTFTIPQRSYFLLYNDENFQENK